MENFKIRQQLVSKTIECDSSLVKSLKFKRKIKIATFENMEIDFKK